MHFLLRWILAWPLQDQVCGLNYSACSGTGPGQMCRVPCLAGYIENTSYVWEEASLLCCCCDADGPLHQLSSDQDEIEMEESLSNISMAGYLLSIRLVIALFSLCELSSLHSAPGLPDNATEPSCPVGVWAQRRRLCLSSCGDAVQSQATLTPRKSSTSSESAASSRFSK